ncbi:MAG: hypothetical protein ACK4YV_10840 [Emticicia sp.]
MKNILVLLICLVGVKTFSQESPAVPLGKTGNVETNLLSKSSFKKLYDNDFSGLMGQDGLPINQIIIAGK